MSEISDILSDETIKKLISASGIHKRSQIELYTKFERFGCIDPYNRLTHTKEYIFFTKPDLHIFKDGEPSMLNHQIANMPIFVDALRRYNNVLKQLQYSSNTASPFINLLSNTVKSNIDMPSLSAGDIETSANIYGTRLFYRKASDASDENHDFSLEFQETQYAEVYMFFKLFDEYQRKKYYGIITPPNDSYIINKVLHDQISIFKFIVGEDGKTLIYWAKLYGCYPKGAPREAFSEIPADGDLKLTVPWKATFVEDMCPNIINDFNVLTDGKGSIELPLYNNDVMGVDPTWATIPYITLDKSVRNPMSQYQLKWRV